MCLVFETGSFYTALSNVELAHRLWGLLTHGDLPAFASQMLKLKSRATRHGFTSCCLNMVGPPQSCRTQAGVVWFLWVPVCLVYSEI